LKIQALSVWRIDITKLGGRGVWEVQQAEPGKKAFPGLILPPEGDSAAEEGLSPKKKI
jgi:hypothetical protein